MDWNHRPAGNPPHHFLITWVESLVTGVCNLTIILCSGVTQQALSKAQSWPWPYLRCCTLPSNSRALANRPIFCPQWISKLGPDPEKLRNTPNSCLPSLGLVTSCNLSVPFPTGPTGESVPRVPRVQLTSGGRKRILAEVPGSHEASLERLHAMGISPIWNDVKFWPQMAKWLVSGIVYHYILLLGLLSLLHHFAKPAHFSRLTAVNLGSSQLAIIAWQVVAPWLMESHGNRTEKKQHINSTYCIQFLQRDLWDGRPFALVVLGGPWWSLVMSRFFGRHWSGSTEGGWCTWIFKSDSWLFACAMNKTNSKSTFVGDLFPQICFMAWNPTSEHTLSSGWQTDAGWMFTLDQRPRVLGQNPAVSSDCCSNLVTFSKV